MKAATLTAIIVGLMSLISPLHTPAAQERTSVSEARKVMDEFMAAFNARDEARWADTLLFPHVRVASGSVIVHQSKALFLTATDLDLFAQLNDWSHSQWDSIEVIQADDEKVHFKVKFTRFNTAGVPYVTYDSLYIVQRTADGWGIRARSSFAP